MFFKPRKWTRLRAPSSPRRRHLNQVWIKLRPLPWTPDGFQGKHPEFLFSASLDFFPVIFSLVRAVSGNTYLKKTNVRHLKLSSAVADSLHGFIYISDPL